MKGRTNGSGHQTYSPLTVCIKNRRFEAEMSVESLLNEGIVEHGITILALVVDLHPPLGLRNHKFG
jgi:hypothetical protein